MATSNISYRINYSDQGRRTTDGVINATGALDNFFIIDPLATNSSSAPATVNGVTVAPTQLDLTFTGYRNPVYGEHLWTNLYKLLEHFASKTAPLHPTLGQLWFDKSSELGQLRLCIDEATPIWKPISSRIIVSPTPPITQDQINDEVLWFNPTNRGLFFWDPVPVGSGVDRLVGTTSYPTSPYTTLDPTGPTTNGVPSLHSQFGLPEGSRWVNVLYNRYASAFEYNQFVLGFESWNLSATNRPTVLPLGTQPTDDQWVKLINYVRAQATAHSISSTTINAIQNTTFKCYSTDRFGFGLMQTYFSAIETALNAIYIKLALTNTPTPVAAFTASVTTGAVPMTVRFTDNSINTVGATYAWNFGDGLGATTVGSVTHVFTSAGTYTTTLTITSAIGTVSTKSVTVQAYAAPVASFQYTPTSGATPLFTRFTDTSTNNPTSWLWNFGDGTTSTARNPTHIYTSVGTFAVTLTATNFAGSTTKTTTITTTSPVVAPVANFTNTPIAGNTPLTVTFTDTSTNTPTSWLWNFGDGTTSTVQNPYHVYTIAGTHTVTLTASNSAGSTTKTTTIAATSPIVAPVASFTKTPASGAAPLAVTFADTSTNGPTSWLWNFGDGTTSTVQHPSRTYNTAGTYTVTLTATNSAGSTSSSTSVIVTPGAVTITISASITNFNAYNNRLTSQHGSAVTVTGAYSPGSVVNIVVNSGVTVGASSTATYAFDTGTGWASTDTLTLTNNGYISGMGGAGGVGGSTNYGNGNNPAGANGTAGGVAFRAQRAIVVTNNGTIQGGGGGGGGAGMSSGSTDGNAVLIWGGSGGGGAGHLVGPGVPKYQMNAEYWLMPSADGTLTVGGAGSGLATNAGPGGGGNIQSNVGGNGGGPGAAGNPGTALYSSFPITTGNGIGGAGGAAVSGNSLITWTSAGTRFGTIG